MDLNDVLNEQEPQKPDPAAEAPAPSEDSSAPVERVTSRRADFRKKEYEAQGRAPDGTFLPKEKPAEEAKPEAKAEEKPEVKPEPVKPVEQPKEELTAKEKAAFAAAADERRKRQALEAELAKLRQAPAQPEGEKKTFWDDPEAALKAHEQRLAQRETQLILNTTERLARARYTDFDAKVAKFSEIVQANPAIAHQWLSAPDPADFAYKTAKSIMDIEAAGGIDQLRVQIEKDTETRVRAKMEEEFKAKEAEREKLRAGLTGSLSDVRGGAPARSVPAFSGPTPLESILK